MTHEDSSMPISYRPDLPDWGVYLRPPESGTSWMHPDDLQVALRMIPSPRVFKRSKWDGEYYWLQYGDIEFRVRPTMWIRVPDIDIDVGQQVELLSRHLSNDAGIYRVANIHFAPRRDQIEFYLRRDGLLLRKPFEREDLRVLEQQYSLRTGFYQHQPPKASIPSDLDFLDVGDLTD